MQDIHGFHFAQGIDPGETASQPSPRPADSIWPSPHLDPRAGGVIIPCRVLAWDLGRPLPRHPMQVKSLLREPADSFPPSAQMQVCCVCL